MNGGLQSQEDAMFDVLSRSKLDRIRELNDAFRKSFAGGRIVMTAAVAELPDMVRSAALAQVAEFDAFDAGNDPRQERDFGSFELCNRRFIWEISYYDKDLIGSSEDPSNPDKTTRVLTVMLSGDY